ncbi:MAG: hypothetical protein Q9166_001840 [cf. Caloplaca sp. 2 TL-2023]
MHDKTQRSKEWNPATFFIVMFLLIGSNAMQLLALRNEFTAFSRRADAKIGLLKEVIERIQKGEDVDVKGLLGTGNPEKEKEWEDVIEEIEEEDRLWQANARRRQKKEKLNQAKSHEEGQAAEKTSLASDSPTEISRSQNAEDTPPATWKGPRGFY